MSSYPPGVTGNEFEIAGPDWEAEEVHFCFHCDKVQDHIVTGFDGMVWKTCQFCLREDVVTEEYEPEPRFDDSRQEEIEWGGLDL